jgi:DNA-binding transcriptional MerR regulator
VSANPLRSGELARLTGVSTDTIRHYERLGILPKSQRTNGGYRMFPASAVERVQLAQRALQLGFSLNELSEILRVCSAVCYNSFKFVLQENTDAGCFSGGES